jgi:hypothetical protein
LNIKNHGTGQFPFLENYQKALIKHEKNRNAVKKRGYVNKKVQKKLRNRQNTAYKLKNILFL